MFYSQDLEHAFKQKDLGVILDCDLTFDEHISPKIKNELRGWFNSEKFLISWRFTFPKIVNRI